MKATLENTATDYLESLGIEQQNLGGFGGEWMGSGPEMEIVTPIDGSPIATVTQVTEEEYRHIVDRAHKAFLEWRTVPAPRRGEIVRQLGVKLREVKKELGALVTLEMGKIAAEGEGEVQEMIDVCDFACGLSRQLYGLTMPSERPDHRMFEQWHTLVLDALDRLLHVGHGVARHQGSHHRPRIPRVSDPDVAVGGAQPADQLLLDRFMHDDPAGGSASLTGCAHRTEQNRRQHEIHIGTRCDNDSVVATQLEDGTTEPLANDFGDSIPHLATPCCRH